MTHRTPEESAETLASGAIGPPGCGLVARRVDAENSGMSREQDIWGRGQRRDGPSEWPSTSFSTIIGETQTARPRRRRLNRYVGLALPFVLALLLGGFAVLTLARHLRG